MPISVTKIVFVFMIGSTGNEKEANIQQTPTFPLYFIRSALRKCPPAARCATSTLRHAFSAKMHVLFV